MSRTYEYYDVTGGEDVITSGFPDVFHYDPSTFYNYTDDNLAATGLEVRDRLLGQAMGFPGSGTYSGVTLLVSSTATADTELGIYTTVQAAIDDVPRVLNYPVNIEIADYGNLGAINITGIKCHGRGALQIEALNYGSDSKAPITQIDAFQQPAPGDFDVATVVSSLPIHNAITQAITQRTSEETFDDTLWAASGRAIAQPTPNTDSEANGGVSFAQTILQTWGFSASLTGEHLFHVDNSRLINFHDYSYSAGPFANVYGQGLSKYYRPIPNTASGTACAAFYGSFFSGVEIKDCNKVKLKGIMVDGGVINDEDPSVIQHLVYERETGLSVTNSNVLLEDVAVVRCLETGILATNSTISVAKNFIVYRVLRQGYTWFANGYAGWPSRFFKDNDNNIYKNSRGIGVYLNHSNLVFDTEEAEDSGLYMRTVTGGCEVGLKSVNSFITGGTRNTIRSSSYSKNGGGADNRTAHLQAYGNNLGFGIYNSLLDFDGRLDSFVNLSGLVSVNSEISVPMFSIDDNQDTGIKLHHSNFYYGKFAEFIDEFGGTSGAAGIPLFQCDWNGVNLDATHDSTVAVHPSVKRYDTVGTWGGNTVVGTEDAGEPILEVSSCSLMRNHGMEPSNLRISKPSILISHNSNADIVGLGYIGNTSNNRTAGKAVKVSENSSVRLLGFKDKWTVITSYGDLSSTAQLHNNWGTAACFADSNSNLELVGPTKISRYGVDVLAENQSKMYVGSPVESGFNLHDNKYGLSDAGNHTCAEFHSSRACLVGNHDSTIKLYGLGASSNTSSVYETPGLYNDTSGGYIAFLPNGFTENILGEDTSSMLTAESLDKYSRNAGFVASGYEDHDTGSTGGMCVRAVNDSSVEVDLVDFKFGMEPSSVSGAFYNWHGTGAEFIDNMENYTPLSNTTHTCWIAQFCCECADTPTTTSSHATTSTATASTPQTPTTTTPTEPTTTEATTTATDVPTTTTTEATTTEATTTTATVATTTSTESTVYTTTATVATTSPTDVTTTPTDATPTTTTATSSTTTATTEPTLSTTTPTTSTPGTTTSTFTSTTSTEATSTTTSPTDATTTPTPSTTTPTQSTTPPTDSTTSTAVTTTPTDATTTPTAATTTSTDATTTATVATTPPTTTPPTSPTTTPSTTTATVATTTLATTTEGTPTTTSPTDSTTTPTDSTTTEGTLSTTPVTTTVATTLSTSVPTTLPTTTWTDSTPQTTTPTQATLTTATPQTMPPQNISTQEGGGEDVPTVTEATTATPTSTLPSTVISTFTNSTTTQSTNTTTTPITPASFSTTVDTETSIFTVTRLEKHQYPSDFMGAASDDEGTQLNLGDDSTIEFSGFGSKIHMWNVCDTSRIRASVVSINKNDPLTECVNNNWHGPTGRWYNGAACDYYGKYGLYAFNQWTENTFRNQGIFRIMMGVQGDLKSFSEHYYLAAEKGSSAITPQLDNGGSPVDQLNAQGYQTAFDIGQTLPGTDITSANVVDENASSALSGISYMFGGGLAGYYRQPGRINGIWTAATIKEGAHMKFQFGQLHPAFAVPPLRMRWEGYLDNMFDETALCTWANAKHAANKKVGLLSVYKSNKLPYRGGEGRDGMSLAGREISFGEGVRSLNIFELKQLV